MMLIRTFVVSSLAVALAGCSSFSSDKKTGADYRTAGAKLAPLELPPDLTAPSADDRFVVPDSKSTTTFSAYNRDRSGQAAPQGSSVLPKIENATIVRAGDQRWLVVSSAPEKIWVIVKEFWQENGFVLKRESPDVGIMETEWAENRAKIPMDGIRSLIGKAFDGLYSTSERDKFRTRLEAGGKAGTTEVFISHRGMVEIFPNQGRDTSTTVWQPRPADRELEAEMLGRLMVKLGIDEKKSVATVAAATPSADTGAVYDKNGAGALRLNEPFDRGWRRVGLALDRVGFTVEDRDRSKGLYFVRYIDPEADNKKSGEKGFMEKLAFWRKDTPDDLKPQYRIRVADAGGASVVDVQNAKGDAEDSATGKRILGLLFEQLK
jgi:outer membrane protein assembly factor BamC